ncbi:hypothetical protein K3495_g9650 [Podosphaera aphanis]|nr:hypothetical protein K3495_g9650 [Podosphaera aphanis]
MCTAYDIIILISQHTPVNRRYNTFDVPDNDEEEVQRLMSLGHRAAEPRDCRSCRISSPNMNDADDDHVSGDGTAAGACPS